VVGIMGKGKKVLETKEPVVVVVEGFVPAAAALVVVMGPVQNEPSGQQATFPALSVVQAALVPQQKPAALAFNEEQELEPAGQFWRLTSS